MWILYALKKNPRGGYNEQCVSRLRPHQAYVICREGKFDQTFQATVETESFPRNEVVDPKSKPAVRLIQVKSSRHEALVSETSVEDDYFLHDTDVIHVKNQEARFRLRWEDMTVFRDGPSDDDYEIMVEEASEFGFHLSRTWHKSVTHVWISDTPTSEISTYLIRALMQKKYIITKQWLQDVFLQSQDRRFISGPIYDTIQPIVWDNFGPLKRPAKLSIDHRRGTLFEDMHFISFEQSQTNRLSSLVSFGRGKVVFYDLANEYDMDISHNTIFIAPSEERSRTMKRWESLKARLDEQSGTLREIQEVEIGYAIIYCSTNYMCNPVASLRSLNLDSVDTASTSVPLHNIQSQDDKPEIPSCNNATPDFSIALTEQYSEDKKKSENPPCSLRNEELPYLDHPQERELTEAQVAPASPTLSPITDMPHIRDVSPVDPLPLMSDEDDDIPLPSLNNLFNDFVGPLKAKPPPKKPLAETSGSNSTCVTAPESYHDTAPSTSKPIAPPSHPAQSSSASVVNDSSVAGRSHVNVLIHGNDHSPIVDDIPVPEITPVATHKPVVTSNSSSESPKPVPAAVNIPSPPTKLAVHDPTNLPRSKGLAVNRKTSTLPDEPESFVSQMSRPRKQKLTMENFIAYDNEPREPREEISSSKRYSNIIYAPLVVASPPTPAPLSLSGSGGINYKVFKKKRYFTQDSSQRIVPLVSSGLRTFKALRDNQPRQVRVVESLSESDVDPLLLIPSKRRNYN